MNLEADYETILAREACLKNALFQNEKKILKLVDPYFTRILEWDG